MPAEQSKPDLKTTLKDAFLGFVTWRNGRGKTLFSSVLLLGALGLLSCQDVSQALASLEALYATHQAAAKSAAARKHALLAWEPTDEAADELQLAPAPPYHTPLIGGATDKNQANQ